MEISRRKILLGGGALGAVGAFSVASPAGAKALWTWKPSGSVAGQGTGADPKWIWDDETDPLVASLLDRGDVPRVNELLRGWRYNAQPLPTGLPADVREYIEHARQIPSWTDQTRLSRAFQFYTKRGLYLGLCYGFGSGMLSTAIPNEARAVYYSKGGEDMRDRITKTAKLGHDIGDVNAYRPDGDMIVTCVKTRMTHAAVRHLLPQSPYWPAHNGEKPIPISQADIMVTWHSLATFAHRQMARWGLRNTSTELDGFLHLWQVTAHMLGVRDEYIPATWAEADAQAQQVLDPVIAATPEGIKLADILLDIAQLSIIDLNGDGVTPLRPVMHALTRYMLGDAITDSLQIPREDAWDDLVAWAWPRFVAIREGTLLVPLSPALWWTLEEILRNGVIFFLGRSPNVYIEMPTANRMTF
jgi:endo-cleaving rubber dioxygenase